VGWRDDRLFCTPRITVFPSSSTLGEGMSWLPLRISLGVLYRAREMPVWHQRAGHIWRQKKTISVSCCKRNINAATRKGCVRVLLSPALRQAAMKGKAMRVLVVSSQKYQRHRVFLFL